ATSDGHGARTETPTAETSLSAKHESGEGRGVRLPCSSVDCPNGDDTSGSLFSSDSPRCRDVATGTRGPDAEGPALKPMSEIARMRARLNSSESRQASANRMTHLINIVPGPPAIICRAPASVAQTTFRLPSCHACCASKITHGTQLQVDCWLDHISEFSVNPLNANMTPANAADQVHLVQRNVRAYMPKPPQNK